MRQRLLILVGAAACIMAGCSDSNTPVSPFAGSHGKVVEGLETGGDAATASTADLGDSYIVIFSAERQRDHRQAAARLENEIAALHSQAEFTVSHRYDACLRGFSAHMSDRAVVALAKNPNVVRIERDRIATIDAQTLPLGINRIDADLSSTLAGNGSGAVSGVRVYIIDTGINPHADLNLMGGVTFATGTTTYADGNGHGTHVAGTVGAIDDANYVVGVAPGVELYAVRVLGANGSGSFSDILAGVNYVTQQKLANPGIPMVANMSLGGAVGTTTYNTLDLGIQNSIATGVFYAIAAGNSSANAQNTSPAHVVEAVTVGSYNPATNRFSSFSNYGAMVDILAPGENILSTSSAGGTTSMSGTSMASPHVAGAAALYLSHNPLASPDAVRAAMLTASTNGTTAKTNPVISKVKPGTTNKSLYAKYF